jgi:cation transport ATPase
MNTMDELNEKIEDDHFLTPEELAEMKAIIQKSITEAKKNIKLRLKSCWNMGLFEHSHQQQAASTTNKRSKEKYKMECCNHDNKTKKDPSADGFGIDPSTVVYTCPMHPEVEQKGPGSCPKCGMALEPETVTGKESKSPELLDFSRRFWVGLVLSVPLMVLEMGSHLFNIHFIEQTLSTWVQFALATPVVFWSGWPFFRRGWQSLINKSLNMYT